jgi:hypothetical protein
MAAMTVTEKRVEVIEVENGKLVVRDGNEQKTLYLSRFARFDRLPSPGEWVVVKLDKREFVRAIEFSSKTRQEILEEERRMVQSLGDDGGRGTKQTPSSVRSPEVLLRILEIVSYHRGTTEAVLELADKYLEWLEARVDE